MKKLKSCFIGKKIIISNLFLSNKPSIFLIFKSWNPLIKIKFTDFSGSLGIPVLWAPCKGNLNHKTFFLIHQQVIYLEGKNIIKNQNKNLYENVKLSPSKMNQMISITQLNHESSLKKETTNPQKTIYLQ